MIDSAARTLLFLVIAVAVLVAVVGAAWLWRLVQAAP